MSDAAHYYRLLGKDFPKVIIKEGKTGAAIYNEIATDKRFLPLLEEARQTWNGNLKATKVTGTFQMQNSFTLEPSGELIPFFSRHRLAIDQQLQQMKVIDQLT